MSDTEWDNYYLEKTSLCRTWKFYIIATSNCQSGLDSMVAFYKYILAWVPMVFIAIINGIIREAIFGKSMNNLRAHQLSTFTGIIFFGAYIWGISKVLPFASAGIAWTVGIVWLFMTIAFEFLFGHYVMHHTWSHLFEDYNIFAGRLWTLVLLWITSSPYIFYVL